MTNLLVVTTLFPNRVQFRHGLFVETRLHRLTEGGDFKAVVIAPVPWFPITSKRFPKYSQYAEVPAMEERRGIVVHHPRYLVIPKIGMLISPLFLALSIVLAARGVKKSGYDYDLVDAHYYYPDGVAVAMVSRFLGKPFAVTARGSDINLLGQLALPRRLIRWAADKAAATVTVSEALRDRLLAMGVDGGKVHVFRNGVDLQHFVPMQRGECKRELGVGSCTLLSVGNLIELKGHDLVIRAMPFLPQCDLLVVGDGKMQAALKALAVSLGVEHRVRFLAAVPQSELVKIYNAADVLVLASSREGMPNVVLEAMACGTPVV
ncbi:MAG: glycosyltransferase, partial [Sedimenticolaceae bacterium]